MTNRYLRRIFEHIAVANKETFSGNLSPQNFCVGVEVNDICPRAFADPTSRNIAVFTGLIVLAKNDSQIAAVMAHEMAHNSMRHTICDINNLPKGGVAEAVGGRQCEHDRLVDERNVLKGQKESPARTARMSALGIRIDALQKQIYDITVHHIGPEQAANWLEVEADEVGQEFFHRAGLNQQEFAWRHEQLVLWPPMGDVPPAAAGWTPLQRRNAAMAACHLTPFTSQAPPRGVNRYAESCWSLWNLLINPARVARRDFRRILPTAVQSNIAGEPSLADVQAELARHRAAPEPTKKCKTCNEPPGGL